MNFLYENLIAGGAWQPYLSGILVTLQVTLMGLLLGTLLGGVLCACARSHFAVLRALSRGYTVLVRGTPVLLLMMLLYYVVLAPLRTDALWTAFLAFGLNAGAHIGEIMRSAVASVNPGQIEAAYSMGFGRMGAFFAVTFPQAVRFARPVYQNAVVNILQWTSVVGYISLSDLTRVVNNMGARTGNPFAGIAFGISFYLALAGLVNLLFYLTRDRRAG
jgi:polar amino acid transport system permease protein/polar amino acid transport system substrate-binding protein